MSNSNASSSPLAAPGPAAAANIEGNIATSTPLPLSQPGSAARDFVSILGEEKEKKKTEFIAAAARLCVYDLIYAASDSDDSSPYSAYLFNPSEVFEHNKSSSVFNHNKDSYRVRAEKEYARKGKYYGLPIGVGFVDPKTVPGYAPAWEHPVFMEAISWGCKCGKCGTAALADDMGDMLKCWASRSK